MVQIRTYHYWRLEKILVKLRKQKHFEILFTKSYLIVTKQKKKRLTSKLGKNLLNCCLYLYIQCTKLQRRKQNFLIIYSVVHVVCVVCRIEYKCGALGCLSSLHITFFNFYLLFLVHISLRGLHYLRSSSAPRTGVWVKKSMYMCFIVLLM